MDISTGGTLVAILNEHDARRFDLYPQDRIVITKGKKKINAVVDIAASSRAVPRGKIGLMEETLDKIKAKNNDIVNIDIQEKPRSVSIIKKKMDGNALDNDEIDEIVSDVVAGNLTNTELAYFVGACYTRGMSLRETLALTRSTVKHGGQLKFDTYPIIDKHCSGGVPGNRTTMIVVPILAAAGFTIPKTSSRSITSPSGTADTMEVLAPVSLSLDKIKKTVNKVGACIVWGGAVDLAGADDKLIKVRHSLAIDPEGMLLASILAKKAAVHSTHVLIDIPIGSDTKIKTIKEAVHLKRMFVKIGGKLGMKIKVIITDGTEPIGNGIGPVLEAKDVLYVLRRDERRPLDLEKKSVMMAGEIMKMVGVRKPHKKARQILESGFAYQKMKEIIKAQGGNPNIDPDKLRLGRHAHTYHAPKAGLINDIDNITIAKMARIAGAPKDSQAGLYLYKHEGQRVTKGEPIFTLYADNAEKLHYALHILERIGGVTIDHGKIKKKKKITVYQTE